MFNLQLPKLGSWKGEYFSTFQYQIDYTSNDVYKFQSL